MRKNLRKILMLIVLNLFLMITGALAQVSSGGVYTLNQTVIANGGGTSTNTPVNSYRVEGTAGQPTAGIFAVGGSYTTRSGFWAPNPFAPTAAGVSISGRVLDLNGAGLPKVLVTLSGGTLLVPLTARTSSFGYFKFDDVEVGQVYIISVQSKRYGFGQNLQIISLLDEVTDLVFQAGWEN